MKHNLIIKGIEKSWTDEDLNRYIDELMQEIREDERNINNKKLSNIKKRLKEEIIRLNIKTTNPYLLESMINPLIDKIFLEEIGQGLLEDKK